jgi:hypothetical protein
MIPTRINVSTETLALRKQANEVAYYLLDHSDVSVQGIELYGSLARGNGTALSDIDMIVLVDGFLAAKWIRMFKDSFRWQGNYSASIKPFRFQAARELLKFDESELVHHTGVDKEKIDLSVFPVNWKGLIPEMCEEWHRWNPRFLSDIAADAIRFVPFTGFPFPNIRKPDPIGPRDYPSNNY